MPLFYAQNNSLNSLEVVLIQPFYYLKRNIKKQRHFSFTPQSWLFCYVYCFHEQNRTVRMKHFCGKCMCSTLYLDNAGKIFLRKTLQKIDSEGWVSNGNFLLLSLPDDSLFEGWERISLVTQRQDIWSVIWRFHDKTSFSWLVPSHARASWIQSLSHPNSL